MQKPCDTCKQCSRPVVKAIECGHDDCLNTLVNNGASVKDKSEAFCRALRCSNIKCTGFLLDTGIDVNFKIFYKITPLRISRRLQHRALKSDSRSVGIESVRQ